MTGKYCPHPIFGMSGVSSTFKSSFYISYRTYRVEKELKIWLTNIFGTINQSVKLLTGHL